MKTLRTLIPSWVFPLLVCGIGVFSSPNAHGQRARTPSAGNTALPTELPALTPTPRSGSLANTVFPARPDEWPWRFPAPTTPASGPDEGPFSAVIHQVAREYQGWGRVDDERRWAPFLCRTPRPGRTYESHADTGDHARKLYFLYARDRFAYVTMAPGAAVPVGQVIVKESWIPRELTAEERSPNARFAGLAATREGRSYVPAHPAGLFVMVRLPENTPQTDHGWVYGTVDLTGRVTSSGRVASCMGCHAEGRSERLMGLGRNS